MKRDIELKCWRCDVFRGSASLLAAILQLLYWNSSIVRERTSLFSSYSLTLVLKQQHLQRKYYLIQILSLDCCRYNIFRGSTSTILQLPEAQRLQIPQKFCCWKWISSDKVSVIHLILFYCCAEGAASSEKILVYQLLFFNWRRCNMSREYFGLFSRYSTTSGVQYSQRKYYFF